MKDLKKTALITGASSGIGYELAKVLAADQYDLVLVARSEEKMKRFANELHNQHGGNVQVISKDLGLPSAAQEVYEQLQNEQIAIDLLVNNAGFGGYGAFSETDLQAEVDMIELNITALTRLTKLFLPHMIQQRSGGILNVASTAAFQPGPLMAVYYATKAYVLHFSEALASEVQDQGVTVTALCPGPTKTAFVERANLGQSKLFDMGAMDAATVARVGYEGWKQKKAVVIPGLKNKLLAGSVRLAPRKTITNVVAKMQARREQNQG